MPSLPEVEKPFAWHQEPWGSALTCGALGGIRHLFSTRHLELSGPDGWKALARSAGVESKRLVTARQVHGAQTVVVARGAAIPDDLPDGDALISNDPSVAVAVRTADCTPILLADLSTGAVGAVHAGWRGTAAGIAGATVAAMVRAFGTRPENLVASIGPTISHCCYDVGPELVDAFAAHGHARYLVERWFLAPPPRRGEPARPGMRLDLVAANRDQLVLGGLAPENVHASGLCTAVYLDVFTSFRAEGARAGRLAAIIRAGESADLMGHSS